MMKRVIIDTDPGVDDAVAIICALASPQLDVVGITTVAGNHSASECAANALRVLAACGVSDVPVHVGMDRSLLAKHEHSRQSQLGSWGDHLAPAAISQVSDWHAIDAIAYEAQRALDDGVALTLCALGPLSNVAMALHRYEHVRRGISDLVVMGGAFAAMGMRTPWAEYNIYADPVAAKVVMESGVPLTLFPLDVTFQALLTDDMALELAHSGSLSAQTILRLLNAMDRSDLRRFGRGGAPLHDPMPVAWMVKPELFEVQPANVRVVIEGETVGQTYADFFDFFGEAPNVQVARKVDSDAYLRFVLDCTVAFP